MKKILLLAIFLLRTFRAELLRKGPTAKGNEHSQYPDATFEWEAPMSPHLVVAEAFGDRLQSRCRYNHYIDCTVKCESYFLLVFILLFQKATNHEMKVKLNVNRYRHCSKRQFRIEWNLH